MNDGIILANNARYFNGPFNSFPILIHAAEFNHV